MQEKLNNKAIQLEKAEALVSALKADRDTEVEQLIRELSVQKESHLFIEVGRLTRELHEAINGFLTTGNNITRVNRRLESLVSLGL